MQQRVSRANPDKGAKVRDLDNFAFDYFLQFWIESECLKRHFVVSRAVAGDQLANRTCIGIGYHNHVANLRAYHALIFFLKYLYSRVFEGMRQPVWRDPD